MKTKSISSLTIPVHQTLCTAGDTMEEPKTALDSFAVVIFAKISRENESNHQPEQAARLVALEKAAQRTEPDRNTLYKCNYCGKQMKLSEAAMYDGRPACPACLHVCAPVEFAEEPSDRRGGGSSNVSNQPIIRMGIARLVESICKPNSRTKA